MKRNIFEVYALAVCFIAVLILIIATGIGIYDLIEISFPEFTITSYLYNEYSSNEKYIQNNPRIKNLSEEEITSKRESKWNDVIENERRNGYQSIIQVLIFIIISILVFTVHWLFAKKIQLRNSSKSG